MRLEELDRKLRRLRAASERIGAELLEVELDTHRQLLDESKLEGDSASRWAATSAALLQLWEWQALVAARLERAAKMRGTRARLRSGSLAELNELVEDPIECSHQAVPPAERAGQGSSQARRLSPDELLELMSVELGKAKDVLAQIANAWDVFTPRLGRAGAVVSEASELCDALGESEPQELGIARQRVSQLTEALARDPLSVTADDFDALEGSVASLRADFAALGELRDEIGDRLACARELLEELRRAQQDGEAAYADARVKVVAPAVPRPIALAGVEQELEQVVELCEAGAWRQAREALSQWTARATTLLEKARTIALENRVPIEARNQLRGLLEAYQAKATQLGLIEDPELSDIYEDAQRALYTAPTDLEQAEALLRRYQRALPSISDAAGPRR